MNEKTSATATSSLQAMFIEQLRAIPRLMLAKLVQEKITASGNVLSSPAMKAIEAHILAGRTDSFIWEDGSGDNVAVEIEITKTDLAELERRVDRFFKEQAGELVDQVVETSSKSILRKLDRDWKNQSAHEAAMLAPLLENIEERFGKGLTGLRMLLVCAREIGAEYYDQQIRSHSKGKTKRDVLFRLHSRACQVAAEIIALMENGFADGAMARWRTLHEIAVIASLLYQHDEDLTERYLAHEAVEAKRALDNYNVCSESLGYAPYSKRAARKVERGYEAALAKYGHRFGSSYGWATKHLAAKKLTFLEIEKAVGQHDMRAYYQMAGYNVHATPKGIAFRLGLIDQGDLVISGATNAGLTEPGQNTAVSLVQVTGLLFSRSSDLEEMIKLRVLIAIRDRIPAQFASADRALKRAHDQMKRETAKPRPLG